MASIPDALTALTLEDQFSTCVDFIATGGEDKKGTGGSNMPGFGQKGRLAIYKWYKQIHDGDISGEKPSYTSAVMKTGGPLAGAEMLLKYDAWASVKGKSKDDAMKNYVLEIVEQCVSNEREDILIRFVQSKVTK
eukprot:CAMPEP_0171309196 /NCGR_PEP_ID=MMETSP0816-20121228/19336_1 /TAXON_ID=420281 /ORGANISM="Proboscia inermis, Strain CCAP1064/1" /LENGTH=134 /DNA_ID=CAMNT_0011792539 /DNA_START=12 /DNA_END=416 /DNA_ORIENTATION=+